MVEGSLQGFYLIRLTGQKKTITQLYKTFYFNSFYCLHLIATKTMEQHPLHALPPSLASMSKSMCIGHPKRWECPTTQSSLVDSPLKHPFYRSCRLSVDCCVSSSKGGHLRPETGVLLNIFDVVANGRQSKQTRHGTTKPNRQVNCMGP